MKITNDRLNKLIKYVFFGIMILGPVYSIFRILISHISAPYGIFFLNTSDTFMDFFNSIVFSKSNIQFQQIVNGAIYPPINYLIFFAFSRGLSGDSNAFVIRNSQSGLMLITILILFFVLAIIYLLYTILKTKHNEKIIFIICFIFSAPLLFLIERGNILAFSLILLLIFIRGIDSENKYLREIALICLGLAAAIKIYPAIFGLVLLYNKRYKETLRCASYGLLFFILPFFFYGGIPTIILYFSNMKSGIESVSYAMTGVGYRVDLQTICSILSIFLKGSHVYGQIVSDIIIYPLLISLILFTFLFKEKWKKILCIVIIMVTFPGFNYEYSMVFYVIPLMFFMNEKHYNKRDLLYAVLLSFTLVIVADYTYRFAWMQSNYPLTLNVLIQNIGQFSLIVMLFFDALIEFHKKIRKKLKIKKILTKKINTN